MCLYVAYINPAPPAFDGKYHRRFSETSFRLYDEEIFFHVETGFHHQQVRFAFTPHDDQRMQYDLAERYYIFINPYTHARCACSLLQQNQWQPLRLQMENHALFFCQETQAKNGTLPAN